MIINILALDLGRTSLGLAISRSGIMTSSLPNLHFKHDDWPDAINKLKQAIKNEVVEHIVIGLPLYPSGDECEMTPIVKSFVKRLNTEFPTLDITYIDERNTTIEASEVLHINNKSSKKQKNIIDSEAARIILERYLRQINQL